MCDVLCLFCGLEVSGHVHQPLMEFFVHCSSNVFLCFSALSLPLEGPSCVFNFTSSSSLPSTAQNCCAITALLPHPRMHRQLWRGMWCLAALAASLSCWSIVTHFQLHWSSFHVLSAIAQHGHGWPPFLKLLMFVVEFCAKEHATMTASSAVLVFEPHDPTHVLMIGLFHHLLWNLIQCCCAVAFRMTTSP